VLFMVSEADNPQATHKASTRLSSLSARLARYLFHFRASAALAGSNLECFVNDLLIVRLQRNTEMPGD